MFEIARPSHEQNLIIKRNSNPALIEDLQSIGEPIKTDVLSSLKQEFQEISSEASDLASLASALGGIDWTSFGTELQQIIDEIDRKTVDATFQYQEKKRVLGSEHLETRVKRSLDTWIVRNARAQAIGLRNRTRRGVEKAVEFSNSEDLAYRSRDLFNSTVGLYPGYITAVYNRLGDALEDNSDTQAIKQAQDYADGLTEVRAERIINNEAQKAINQTRQTYFNEAFNLDLLNRTGVQKQWVTGFESCRLCKDLDMTKVPWNQTFQGDIYFPPAHPACYGDSTEVFTENGWKLFKDVTLGEKIWSLEPDSREMELVGIEKKIKREASEMFSITNKRHTVDMLVTTDHPFWGYKRTDHGKAGRSLEPRTFHDIEKIPLDFKLAISGSWRGKKPEYIDLSSGRTLISPIRLKPEIFAKFMGYWLAEGSVSQRNHSSVPDQVNIAQSQGMELIVKDLEDFPFSLHPGKTSIYIFSKNLASYLKQFGHAHQKFIPQELKELAPIYLEKFLSAFCLGDGYIKKGKMWKGAQFGDSRHFTTSSPQLAADLGELLLKIGHSVSYDLKETEGKKQIIKGKEYIINHDIWQIHELKGQHRQFGSLDIEKIPYEGLVYDLELRKNHTLLTRRNGRVIWGSNCDCSFRVLNI